MHEPTKGTKEAEILEVLRNPKEWIWLRGRFIRPLTNIGWELWKWRVGLSLDTKHQQPLDIKIEQQHSVK